MRLFFQAAVSACAFSALISSATAGGLVPHRVAYDLMLEKSAQLADAAVNMKGRMVYEFLGNACEGYTTNFRFVLETGDGEGNSATTDLRTSNFESSDGRSFDFTSQTFTNEVQTDDIKGSAVRDGADVNVKLKLTEERDYKITKPVIFPTAQLLKTIEEAEKGTTVFSDDIYDGTDGGEHVFHTSTVIGTERKTPPDETEKPIGDLKRWPVTVSYFTGEAGGDQPPDYSISFDLWQNGVSSKMRLDYGDFVLNGKIVHFELLPQTPCDPAKPNTDAPSPAGTKSGDAKPNETAPATAPDATTAPQETPADTAPAQTPDSKTEATPAPTPAPPTPTPATPDAPTVAPK